MKLRLVLSFVLLALLSVVTVVDADIRARLSDAISDAVARDDKAAGAFTSVAATTARYRSPLGVRKLVIPSDDDQACQQARRFGAVEIAAYGSFRLFALPADALEAAEAQGDRFTVRDDYNVLLLRAGAIDTTETAAAGTFFGIGQTLSGKPAPDAERQTAKTKNRTLRLIQFVGPTKSEWLEQLRADGFELIAYVPNNGYLVRGTAAASERLAQMAHAAAARGEAFLQWEGAFEEEYKIHPALLADVQRGDQREVSVAIQIARSADAANRRPEQDVAFVKRQAASIILEPYPVLGFTNVRLRIRLDRLAEIAARENVVNIEPWSPPQLFDEKAAQIIAADLIDEGKKPRAPGYLAWLTAHGLHTPFSFILDVSDSGVDQGSTAAAKLHPDFLDASGQGRLRYARDYTSDNDPGDISGHGTINLSIAGGSNMATASGLRDADGYGYGIGVAPGVMLGSSKIFLSSGTFDLNQPYSKLIADAYRDGARISSNSWGSAQNEYTIDAQEYDSRARDALPAQPGNQEILLCFAAGNAGVPGFLGSPSTGKNVISVGASEGFRTGEDGCAVEAADADNALDLAFFSSRGPLRDGRIKPDIVAPGSHIQGAASQHEFFDATGICGSKSSDELYFPKDQTLYTWSSGTSHSTPAVAGAAALVRQFFLNRGEEPSAALIRALLLNTTTYMTGERAGGSLPHPAQGWGLLNLNRAFDNAAKIFINQSHTFTSSGQDFVMTGDIKDSGLPVRITLAWTDAPGLSAIAPWVNDLDLEVFVNGELYRGNHLVGQTSQPGGEADSRNTTEAVWLPAGISGSFLIRVRAANIAGDGVPGNGQIADQDFALVVYNGERKDVAVSDLDSFALTGGADEIADPGETVALRVHITNLSPVALTGGQGVLTTTTAGVTITTNSADFPILTTNATGENLTPFTFMIAPSVACGTDIQFTLNVNSGGSVSKIPFSVVVGKTEPNILLTDDAEAGEVSFTHGSLIKKKKKRIDTWMISDKRFRSGSHAWFTANLDKQTDSFLSTPAITLPTSGRRLQLVFYHAFQFERGGFDGGVLEISSGGNFTDLGDKIIEGGYTGTLFRTTTNPLSERKGWINGNIAQFQRVVVDLSSFAGQTVTIRFRIGTDSSVKGVGWFVDDVTIGGERVICTAP